MAILFKLQKKIYCCNSLYFCGKSRKNNYICIKGQTRKNVGVSLDDYVLIKKTYPKSTEKLLYYVVRLNIFLMNLFHILATEVSIYILFVRWAEVQSNGFGGQKKI